MFKWATEETIPTTTSTAKNKNISLPKPGKLLKTIQEYPFDCGEHMPVGSYVLFLFANKVALENNVQDIKLWLFCFLVDGEQRYLRWYEDVPIPQGIKIQEFDWTEYWQYVYPE